MVAILLVRCSSYGSGQPRVFLARMFWRAAGRIANFELLDRETAQLDGDGRAGRDKNVVVCPGRTAQVMA